MNLSHRQLDKLRSVARVAHEVSAAQRARTSAYQRSIVFQRDNAKRIETLEQSLGSAIKTRDRDAYARELAHLRAVNADAGVDSANLQREIEQARAFVTPLQALVDAVTRHAGVSKAQLGIDFAADGTRRSTLLTV